MKKKFVIGGGGAASTKTTCVDSPQKRDPGKASQPQSMEGGEIAIWEG